MSNIQIETEKEFNELIKEKLEEEEPLNFSNVVFNIPVTPALLKNISIEKKLRFTLSFENAIFLKEVDFTRARYL